GDSEKYERDDNCQPARGTGLILELATIGDVVAGRKCHPLTNSGFHIRREPAEVAPAHVALHNHVTLPALVVNYLGSLDRPDPSDLRQRDRPTSRSANQRLFYGLRRGP